MKLSKRASIAALGLAAFCWAGPAAAESDTGASRSAGEQTSRPEDDPDAENASDPPGRASAESDGAENDTAPPDPPAEDASPGKRLQLAEDAFRNGDFGDIPPLLTPVLGDEPAFQDDASIIRARELLGVGLYFEAQEATDPDRRDALLDRSRQQFLALLRRRPDYQLDSLMFPASVVELFESVREEHADELESIREERTRSDRGTGGANSESTETVYIERIVERRVLPLNFLPLGSGQFQNDQPLKGALFGGGQLASAAVIGVGFWRIESLRQSNGKFRNPRVCNCDDLRTARSWRTAQWVALGSVGVLYVGSVIDGVVNYLQNDDNIRIRMRDEPPPELSSSDSSAGNGPSVQLGFGSVRIRW
jgi:hypothetical protein